MTIAKCFLRERKEIAKLGKGETLSPGTEQLFGLQAAFTNFAVELLKNI